MYRKGRVLEAELHEVHDPETGIAILQITSAPGISHHMYFLTSSILPRGRGVILASNRGGKFDFYLAELPGGGLLQLTDGKAVNSFSGVFDRAGDRFFFVDGGSVRALDLKNLDERVLADFGEARLGEVSLNSDGSRIVTVCRRAARWYLAVVEIHGGAAQLILESGRTLIHPQFHPTRPDLIIYSQDPAPRMWCVEADGSNNTSLWQHANSEFLVHETFLGAGDDLVLVRWPYAVQRFSMSRRTMTEIARLNAWHIAPTKCGRFVLCDTAHPDRGIRLISTRTGRDVQVCAPRSSNQGFQWLKDYYATEPEWAAAAARGSAAGLDTPADAVYGPQWTHPHPSFGPDERWFAFTSDCTGYPQVYCGRIPEEMFEAAERV